MTEAPEGEKTPFPGCTRGGSGNGAGERDSDCVCIDILLITGVGGSATVEDAREGVEGDAVVALEALPLGVLGVEVKELAGTLFFVGVLRLFGLALPPPVNDPPPVSALTPPYSVKVLFAELMPP